MGKKPELNADMLPLEQNSAYVLNAKRKQSMKKFEVNNWLREMVDENKGIGDVKNQMLKSIYKHGAALWLSMEGNIVYRPSIDADPIELASDEKAKRTFCSLLKLSTVRFFKGYQKEDKYIKPDVEAKELLSVADEFTPFSSSEFYIKDGLWKRTSFRPTQYMLIDRPKPTKIPPNIYTLIINLCNENHEYVDWFINWLAGFFQSLEKSHVAVVFRGDQGSGKSMFFKDVLTKLFGEKHCVIVDQARIESQFKNWIQNILFYNLNEVAVDMKGRKYLKNFLKQLITDTTVQAELKHKDAESVTIYGNILITSNEALPVEIEPTDRRFTVMQTGPSLRKKGIDTAALYAALPDELTDFAKFLKSHKVDWIMYHTALDTPEKRAIQSGTNSKLSLYLMAILQQDVSYFDDLNIEGTHGLYERVIEALKKGKINQDDLIQAYKTMHDVDHSSKRIMENIRMLEPVIFAKGKEKPSNGKKVFTLPWGEQ